MQKKIDSAIVLGAEKERYDENVPDDVYAISSKREFNENELFQFDPNTLDVAGWKRLGLSEKTTRTLINYRNKGGRFYRHEDLKKIWGLPRGFYERVSPYIVIEKHEERAEKKFDNKQTDIAKTVKTIATIDVNNADTSMLIALPGIGSTLAKRIINFRDKLGGFHDVSQISETYGLPDSTFQKLKPYLQVHGVLKKFNINTATKEELAQHPYIKWKLANAIIAYREQHGLFKKLEDLKNIMLIDEATFQKITPYLIVE